MLFQNYRVSQIFMALVKKGCSVMLYSSLSTKIVYVVNHFCGTKISRFNENDILAEVKMLRFLISCSREINKML